MKFTSALALIAGLAYGKNSHHVPFTKLELAQIERVDASPAPIERTILAQTDAAQTAETADGVTHPDTRGVDVTILDREASTKTAGIVSYQLFFDAKVDAIQTKVPADPNFTNGLYDTDTHICAFRFRWEKPLAPATERYMIAVTHDCPDGLTPPIGGFKFIISLPATYNGTNKGALVSSSHRS